MKRISLHLLLGLLIVGGAQCFASISGPVFRPGGTQGQIQYNSNGVFRGAEVTYDTTTHVVTFSSAVFVTAIVWPDGTIQISSPTVPSGGSQMYPSTGIPDFQYGIKAASFTVNYDSGWGDGRKMYFIPETGVGSGFLTLLTHDYTEFDPIGIRFGVQDTQAFIGDGIERYRAAWYEGYDAFTMAVSTYIGGNATYQPRIRFYKNANGKIGLNENNKGFDLQEGSMTFNTGGNQKPIFNWRASTMSIKSADLVVSSDVIANRLRADTGIFIPAEQKIYFNGPSTSGNYIWYSPLSGIFQIVSDENFQFTSSSPNGTDINAPGGSISLLIKDSANAVGISTLDGGSGDIYFRPYGYTELNSTVAINNLIASSATIQNVSLSTIPASNLSGSGTMIRGMAGEALTGSQVVYLKSDGKYWKAKADSATTTPAVAMVYDGSIGANEWGNIMISGIYKNTSWSFTVGGMVYLSAATAGALTTTAPSTAGQEVQIVGYAMDANTINFQPEKTWIELQ